MAYIFKKKVGKRSIAITLTLILMIMAGVCLYCSIPKPSVFKTIESPLNMTVGEKVKFIREYSPDQSFLAFDCICENKNIASIGDDKETVTALGKGKTKIQCSARGTRLAEIEINVKE